MTAAPTLNFLRDTLIAEIGDSASASVYRDLWGDEREYSRLPVMSRTALFGISLQKRRYQKRLSFVKVVRATESSFLSEWAYDDIAREGFGVNSKRPMTYFADAHEGIEKSVWCYENGMVPLVGESHNPSVALAMADRYNIDSLISDEVSLQRLRPYIESRSEILSSISIIGTQFHAESIQWAASCAKTIRLVLSLAETGVFAEAPFSIKPVFVPFDNCIVESENTLLLTKIASLVTPIIRYDTGISSSSLRIQL